MWIRLTQVIDGKEDISNLVNMDTVKRFFKQPAGTLLQFIDSMFITVRESVESIEEKVSK
jgi:ABC-type bacteriocin/lantibiotic exporter with double-glycine peptidase domain